MTNLSSFPILGRWPARHPDRLQLYSLPTPNGVKVSIMLEEIGLPYEPHAIDIGKNETWTPEFLSLNPNGKIPAIIDPDGPGGKPLGLFESGAILLYLAEKTGKLLPTDPRCATRPSSGCSSRWRRSGRCSARSAISTSSPAGRSRTSGRSSAIATNPSACSACWRRGSPAANGSWARTTPSPTSRMLGWVRNLIGFYEAGELVDFDSLAHVPAWLEPAWHARPCSAASKFPSGRHNRNGKGRPRGRPDTRLAG